MTLLPKGIKRRAKEAGKSVNQLLVDRIRPEVCLEKQKGVTTEYTDFVA